MDPLLEKNLITTKEASEISGYAPDYLSRLARDGKVSARRIGRSWLIDSASLEAFVRDQNDRNTVRARALARAREEQYLAHRSISSRTKRALAAPVASPVFRFPKAPLRAHAFALLVALAVVGGGAAVAQAALIPAAFSRVALVANQAADGFHEAFGDIPMRIASRIRDASLAMETGNARVAERVERTTESLAQNSLPFPTQAELRMRIAPDSKSASVPAVRSIAASSVHELTFADFRAGFEAARSFAASPENAGTGLLGAYAAVGEMSYRAEQASFGAYLALVRSTGASMLALGARMRDALALAPRATASMNLALGNAVIDLAHGAIGADVSLAYGVSASAPEVARVSVALIGGIGSIVQSATLEAPQDAGALAFVTIRATQTAALASAYAVWSAEYAVAEPFVAGVHSAETRYLALVTGTGGDLRAALVAASSAARSVPAIAQGARASAHLLAPYRASVAALFASGSSELSAAAAVAPTLSVGEGAALYTYRTISGFFASANGTLAALFGAQPEIVLPNVVPNHATTSAPAKPAGATHVAVTTYPTYTTNTVVQGVSADVLNQSLANLHAELLNQVAAMIAPVSSQVATNITTIQQVNMIQTLSGLTVHDGTFDGGNLTNAGTVQAGVGSFGTLSAGTTTISGGLTVSGALAFSALQNCASLQTDAGGNVSCGSGGGGGGSDANFVFFNNSGIKLSTTTNQVLLGANATSSLAELEVHGNQYLGGMLGIGTTSPFAALSVAGGTYLGGNLTATGTVAFTSLGSGLLYANSSGVLSSVSTSTWRFASSTLLADSNTFIGANSFGSITTFANLLATASSTLQNFTFLNATGTNATTTNLSVRGTASTTQLVISGLGNGSTQCLQIDGQGRVSGIGGACGTGSGSVTSVSSSDGTLTISPTTGAVFASLNLGNANTWSAPQTFANLLATGSSTLQNFTALLATTSQATTTSLAISGISSSLLKTTSTGSVIAAVAGVDYANFAYPFSLAGNATSTLTQFNGGLTAYASTTIGDGTQAGGLTISGNATTTGNAYFAGNVGIGTNAPGSTLDVNGTINAGSGGNGTLKLGAGGGITRAGNNYSVGGTAANNILILVASGGEKARITATGNFGIGTTSPFAKLSVHANNGDTNSTLFAIASSTASATTTLFSISNTGAIQTALSTGLVYSNNGLLTPVSTSTWTFASSTFLADSNTFSGANTFTSAIAADITGNAGTVTNGVYTTTFNGLFDSRFVTALAATTSVSSITTLPGLTLPVGQLSGQVNLATQVTGTLPQGNGGTGIASYSAGDVLYADGSGNLVKLPRGGDGTVLKIQAGLPSWGTDQTLGGGGSDGIFATSSGKIYPLDSSNILLVGADATSTLNSIFEISGQAYISTKLGIATTSPSQALSVGGNGLFSGSLTVGGGLTALASSTIGDGTQAGGLTISGGATTTGNLQVGSNLRLNSSLPNIQIGTPQANNAAAKGLIADSSSFFIFSDSLNANVLSATNVINNFNNFTGLYVRRQGTGTGAYIRALTSAGTEEFNVTSGGSGFFAGNLGIGTTSPFAKLSIHANNGETNSTLFAIASSTSNSTTTLLAIDNMGQTTHTSAGASAFVVGPNGTTNPAFLINDSAASSANGLSLTTAAAASGVILTTISSGANDTLTVSSKGTGGLLLGPTGAGVISFRRSGVEQARFDTNGNFGIGTTSPFAQASIFATPTTLNANGTVFAIGSSTAAFATSTLLKLDNTGALTINNGSVNTLSVPNTGNAVFRGSDSTLSLTLNSTGIGYPTFSGSGSNGSAVAFTTSIRMQGGASAVFQDSGANRTGSITEATNADLRLTNSSGAITFQPNASFGIGIGLTLPAYKLDVLGNGHFTALVDADHFVATSSSAASIFNGGFQANASSTLQNFTALLATTSQATTTSLAISGISSSLLKTTSTGSVIAAVAGVDYANFAYPFSLAGNATSTLTQFNAGLTAYASTTIGDGTALGGLTTNGNSTTTGNALISGTGSSALSVGGANPAFVVDNSAASAATGIKVISNSAGNAATIAAISSSGSETLKLVSKGTGVIALVVNGTTRLSANNTGTAITGVFSASALSTLAGLISTASSTVGDGTQAGGLTISGGATTTGQSFFTGEVGIGTAPVSGNSLRTSGNIVSGGRYLAITNGTAAAPLYTINNGNTNGIFFTSGNSVAFSTGGVESARFTSTGNFGIGTTSPFAKFSLNALPTDTNSTLFAIASSTSNSTTTLFSVSNAGAIQTALSTGLVYSNNGLLTPVSTSTWTFASSTLLADSNTFSGTNSFANTTIFANLLATGSSTLQNFTALLATTSQATTTSLAISGISSSLLKTTSTGSVIAAVAGVDYANFAYPFSLAGNATSTLTQFNGGLTAYASTTIGDGTQAGGLTINGGATTTGDAYIGGALYSGGTVTASSTITASSFIGDGTSALLLSNGGQGVFTADVFANSVAAGLSNTIAGAGTNLAFGANNNSLSTFSSAFGFANTASGPSSSAFGSNNTASNNTSFAFGASNIVSGAQSGAFGYALTNAIDDSVMIGPSDTSKLTILDTQLMGFGTTSPFADFSIQANDGETNTTLFAIGSSTASSLTTLFSVSNAGDITTALASGLVYSNAGVLQSVSTSTWTFASSTLLADSNTFTGGNLFLASTTIGNGTAIGGLTISGGATTTGNAYFAGNVGIGSTSPSALLSIQGVLPGGTLIAVSSTTGKRLLTITDQDEFILGSPTTNYSGNPDEASRLFFDMQTGAFRVGKTTNTLWNDAVVGTDSIGIGNQAEAVGQSDIAIGSFGEASSTGNAIAFGYDVITTGARALGIGVGNSSGGTNPTVSGTESVGIFLGNNRNATVSGTNSLGIFMNQLGGTNISGNNIVAIMGGSVGIGTTSPNRPLTVANSTGPQLALTDGGTNEWTFRSAGGSLYLATSTYSATSSASAFSISSSGIPSFPSLGTNTCLGSTNGVIGTGSCSGGAYPFGLAGNATSTLTQFNGGLTAYASSTIGDGTQAGGLTINGGATTTGNLIVTSTGTSTFAGNIGISGSIVPSADNTYSLGLPTNTWKDVYIGPGSLYVNGKKVIEDISNTITFSTDPDQNLKSLSTGAGSITTQAADSGNLNLVANSGNINVNSASGNLNIGTTGSGQLNFGTVNQGVWQGTAIDVVYGGTGSTTLSGLLKGNGTGGILTAVPGTDYLTPASLAGAYPFGLAGNATSTLTQFNGGLTAFASSTVGNGTQAGGLTISGGATTTGNLLVSGTTKLSGALTYGGVTLSNAVTGTGNMVLATAPSFSTSITSPVLNGGTTNASTLSLRGTTNASPTTASITLQLSSGVGTSPLIKFLTSGIGVGTTTPQYPFEISSSTRPQLTIDSAGGIGTAFRAYSNGSFAIATTNPATFATSSANLLEFDVNGIPKLPGLGTQTCLGSTNGVLGAGTCAAYPFSLAGNATSTLTQFNAGLTAYASTTIGDGTALGGLTINGGATTTGNAYFAGNLGLGVQSPSTKLHISGGDIFVTGSTHQVTTDFNAFNNGLALAQSSGGSAGNFSALITGVANGTWGGDLQFITRAPAGNPAIERMRITADGNVGIGTTTPNALLAVAGTAGSASELFDIASSSGNSYLHVTSAGNIGIGTTSPTSLLTVGGTSNATTSANVVRINSAGYAGLVINGDYGNATNEPGGAFVTFGVDGALTDNGRDNSAIIGKVNASGPIDPSGQTYTGLNSNDFLIGTRSTDPIRLGTNSTVWATLGTAGDLTLGNASIIDGTTKPLTLTDSNGSCTFDPDSSAAVITCSSDARLKTNIQDATSSALAYFAGYHIRDFQIIADGANGPTYTGVIAQEMLTTHPELVQMGDDGLYKVSEPNPYLLVKALQELDAEFGAFASSSASYIGTTTASSIAISPATGNVGIGTSTPSYKLQVIGDVAATAFVNTSTRDAKTGIQYLTPDQDSSMLAKLQALRPATYLYKVENPNDPLRLGLIAEDAAQVAPEVLSADGKGVDIYKLATFTLSGVQALASKLGTDEMRLSSLEQRVAALENGTGLPAATSTSFFSTSTLASALQGFGLMIQKGVAQFGTIVFRTFVASTDSNGDSSAGSATILAGNMVVQVSNGLVKPTTKIFLTFNAQVDGSWWVSDKTDGSFRVVLSGSQAGDVSFDYLLVQTQGQIATSTPDGSYEDGASGPDTVAPVITVLGDNPLHISVGAAFADPGVSVTDDHDGTDPLKTFINGTEQPVNASTIDTSSPTTYLVTYQAMDRAGNSATARRSIIVGNPDGTVSVDGGSGSTASTTFATSTPASDSSASTTTAATSTAPADTMAPVVTLKGAAAIQLTVGGAWTDPGATATDDVDGNVSSSITVSGSVQTATAGLYTLTYAAHDAAGNTGSASRVVSVVAPANTATSTDSDAGATSTPSGGH